MVFAPFLPSRLSVTLFALVAGFSMTRNACFSLSLLGKRETAVRNLHHQLHVVESNQPNSRRAILSLLPTLPVMICSSVESCQAQEGPQAQSTALGETENPRGGKPFAPPGALLPAARLKIVVDQMYDLSITLPKKPNDKEAQIQTLVQINEIWNTRPPLFQKKDKSPLRTATPSSAQLTTGVSSANKQQYQELRKELSLPDRMAAALNQADVERQWGMLQYQESKREQGNELRAALNFYTSQLEFGNAYLLTASKEDRKRLIRNDELPSLTAVITSDLDLRDLYRNDLLTALEDVNAEVAYQIKQPPSEVDVADVVELMEQVHSSITNWFGLIAPMDVKEAMDVVKSE